MINQVVPAAELMDKLVKLVLLELRVITLELEVLLETEVHKQLVQMLEEVF